MGGGFQFIDIILLAMVAAFLVLQLRRVLGRRDGHEGGHQDPFATRGEDKVRGAEESQPGKVIPLPDHAASDDAGGDAGAEEAAADGVPTLSAGLTQIKVADPEFDPDQFLGGARVAFEMVLGAYAQGETSLLQTLLSPEVYANFARVIQDRERAGETQENSLVGIRNVEIVEAFMDGRTANVTVKVVSEQINVTRDAEGHVVDGDPNLVLNVTDFWTFARDTKSRDPNWILVATRSLD